MKPTKYAAEFLESATNEDILSLLDNLLCDRPPSIDLSDDDCGHRVLITQVTNDVYLSVDVQDDVILEVSPMRLQDLQQDILAAFSGYRVGRVGALGLPYERGDTLP